MSRIFHQHFNTIDLGLLYVFILSLNCMNDSSNDKHTSFIVMPIISIHFLSYNDPYPNPTSQKMLILFRRKKNQLA